MKAVLISIRPEWCSRIFSGWKTVEIRKTRPVSLKEPFKCYIYCTKGTKFFCWKAVDHLYFDDRSHNLFDRRADGMVVGEFTCSYIAPIFRYTPWNPGEPAKMYAQCADGEGRKGYTDRLLQDACMNRADVEKYFDGLNGLAGYGWHISELKIYDKPKSILEFHRAVDKTKLWCEKCAIGGKRGTACAFCYGLDGLRIRRPPQSWCYVEELECT